MTLHQHLSGGFTDPVHDAQAAFRGVLDALARPGRRFAVGQPVAGLMLGAAMAHLLLALTDDGTPVWWQCSDAALAGWLRFHTSAPEVFAFAGAAFAVLTNPAAMPALTDFAAGSMASPEHSATLLLEVASLENGPALEWRGPGIQDRQTVHVGGLPDNFWAQWQANHAAFPQGVDIVFTCAGEALGLPRTTRVRRLEGI